ncbi:MAG: two-component system, LytTR family, sensor kinase [Verrucomicrobiota bacterium]|jgi:two-component system, LytTR family, sensor kinase|nr:two-component system, LytTR family, sensor kinase [Verrucomicrobiota bacterium]
MTGPFLSELEIIFDKVCVLVTAAFALTLVPGFRRSERSIASVRNKETKLLVFLLLGFIEEAAVGKTGWFNHRIIAACVAGLLAGPGLGAIVAVFVTWMAVAFDGRPLEPVGISMLFGGLLGGWLYRWRPSLAQHPLTGFCLTATVSLVREGLIFLRAPEAMPGIQMFGQVGIASILQGLGTALILTIVAIVRDRDQQMQAAASAEVSALQSRMNPHFLFNALNALAALSTVAPREVPRAAGRLRDFLRAMFDRPERALISVEEELGAVRAYLDIESLRLGRRLQVEEEIDPALAGMLTLPFSFQPLVENAVQHGVQSSPKAGRLRLVVCRVGKWLEMSVSDDGQGVPSSEVEQIFFAERPRVHALALLRRRLQALFGRSFHLEIQTEVGQGTTARMRIPLQRQPVHRLISGRHTAVGDLADFQGVQPRTY